MFRVRNNIKVLNRHHLPPRNRPRYILAGNHASAADAYFLMAVITGRYLRRIYAVAHERSFRRDTAEKALLEAMEMIPRRGSGHEVVRKMAAYLLANRTMAIPPEGMTSQKVMKGYTGVMRLYWLVNRHFPEPQVPIIPVASIGATAAYPITLDPDGKYRTKKTGILFNIGAPLLFPLPDRPDYAWFRSRTDELMDHIAKLGLQREGAIPSWKQDSMARAQRRHYEV
jgi:1-acyl-sn-glycerol-3-phosphate acyltransferase